MSWLPLSGTVNARDVGGLPTVDGRVTRSGRLWRSADLQGLTEADVAHLVGLGVRTVLDLRHPAEVETLGPGPLEALVEHRRVSFIPQEVEGDVSSVALPSREHRAGDHPSHMEGYYLGYLEDAPAGVAEALRAVAEHGPVLVHCAAGRDRTGVLVALALSLVGVTREAVVADYARTDEQTAAILAQLRSRELYARGLEDASVEHLASLPRSMEAFLAGVDERWGSPLGLAAHLGLSATEVGRLRQALVE